MARESLTRCEASRYTGGALCALLMAIACGDNSSTGNAPGDGGGAGRDGTAGASLSGAGGATGSSGSVGASGTSGAVGASDAGASAGMIGGGGSAGSAPNGGASNGVVAGASSAGAGVGGSNAAGSTGTAGAGTAGAGGSTGTSSGCATGTSNAYFVDSAAGDDSKDGRTTATAWKSIAKVNATTFTAGSSLCFKAGGSWTGNLHPLGSGTSAAPIIVDQYGTGAKPKFAGGTSDLNAVSFVNQEYWELNNLEVTNKKSALGDVRGISVTGMNGGTLEHFYIRNCFVHDVTGVVNWIGGSTADNATGVTFQAGWDASKRTGGIVFEVVAGTGTTVKTKFDDVLLESNTVSDTSFGGIVFKQLDGTVHWGVRNSKTDSNWTPHTNVVIRNNYLSQTNTAYGCNTIYLTDTQNAVVEGNVAKDAGTCAIELYYTDKVTVQKNETFGTTKKAGGADYNGIDSDNSSTGTIIQYNYVHDNGDGILLCQFNFGDSIVRYNMLVNRVGMLQLNLPVAPLRGGARPGAGRKSRWPDASGLMVTRHAVPRQSLRRRGS